MMTDKVVSLDEALAVVHDLSSMDKVRLLEQVAAMLKDEMANGQSIGNSMRVESPADSIPAKLTPAEWLAGLDANSSVEPWGTVDGGLRADDDVVDYLRKQREQASPWHDDSADQV